MPLHHASKLGWAPVGVSLQARSSCGCACERTFCFGLVTCLILCTTFCKPWATLLSSIRRSLLPCVYTLAPNIYNCCMKKWPTGGHAATSATQNLSPECLPVGGIQLCHQRRVSRSMAMAMPGSKAFRPLARLARSADQLDAVRIKCQLVQTVRDNAVTQLRSTLVAAASAGSRWCPR